MAPRTIRVVVGPHLGRDDVHALAEELISRLRAGDVAEVQVDVSDVVTPDLVYVDALARLQLYACRHGCRVRLIGPCPRLLELLALTGLCDVLVDDADASTVQAHREVEHREQPVDIEIGVDPDDLVV
jgi:anti-anti-sigma regulatory factor